MDYFKLGKGKKCAHVHRLPADTARKEKIEAPQFYLSNRMCFA